MRLLLLSLVLLSGCSAKAQYQSLSSGYLGCPVDEVVVTDTSYTIATEAWKATCRGQTYYCSRGGRTVCTPETPKGSS